MYGDMEEHSGFLDEPFILNKVPIFNKGNKEMRRDITLYSMWKMPFDQDF